MRWNFLSGMDQDWDNVNHSAQAEGTEEVGCFLHYLLLYSESQGKMI